MFIYFRFLSLPCVSGKMSQTPEWMNGLQEFITVKDAAAFMGCTLDTIYMAIKIGPPKGLYAKRIIRKPHQTRGRYRIPKQEFLIWAGFNREN